MSSTVLKLIPADRLFQPSREASQRAVQMLRSLLPEGEMWEAEYYDSVDFIDQGENLSAIFCPKCGHSNTDESSMEWWSKLAENAEEAGNWDFDVRMPCCGSEIPVTSLTFALPAGFASFELSIWNPDLGRDLKPEELKDFEDCLGCGLKQIWAHY